jgi:hypothetical protein
MIYAEIDPRSFRRTIRTVNNLPIRYKNAINIAIGAAIIQTRSEAIKNVNKNKSVNTGVLRAKIAMIQNQNIMRGVVKSTANYSSAVEFGRKPGKTPNLQALLHWVRRKQIGNPAQAERITYLIGRSIKRKGIKPRPFMQPAMDLGKEVFKKRYTAEIKIVNRSR